MPVKKEELSIMIKDDTNILAKKKAYIEEPQQP